MQAHETYYFADSCCLILSVQIAQNVSMTLLPDVRNQQAVREGFKIMSANVQDDSDALEFLCPLQVRVLGLKF
jgi:hypothetical protein